MTRTVTVVALISLVLAGCASSPGPTTGPAPIESQQASATPGATAVHATPRPTADPTVHFAPETIALDPMGRLIAADCQAARVILIRDGQLTVVAGSGPAGFAAGFSGDGGPATAAQIQCPIGLAFDSAGRLVLADHGNQRIRRIDPAGLITTIAGSGPSGDPLGSFLGDGGPATKATLREPTVLVFDAAGNLYISDRDNDRVRRVDGHGVITTVAGDGSSEFSGDGGPATSASFDDPAGLAFDKAGNLFVADSNHHRVRRIDRHGIVTTVVGTGTEGSSGDGGPASKAELDDPESLVFDAAGNLYIGDAVADVVRKVTPDGLISTFAGIGTEGHSGDGGPATAAQLGAAGTAFGLAFGYGGELYIAEAGNQDIRVVQPDGIIGTLVRL